MAQHICIISHQHVSRNPRVLKEGLLLADAGYNVTILTSVYDINLLKEDYALLGAKDGVNLCFYNNLTARGKSAFLARFYNRIGRLLTRCGIENKYALGYCPKRCLSYALAMRADLYICHQELPTFVGRQLLTVGCKVAFDFEDFYSEDLLTNERKFRPQKIIENVERDVLKKAALVYTTSKALACGLVKKYPDIKEPKVIFNSFPTYPINLPTESSNLKVIWISQTIGQGRGLGNFIAAMNLFEGYSISLSLRGQVSNQYRQKLQSAMHNPLHVINFLPLIPNEDIQSSFRGYHFGLASEKSTPLSRNLTITNKIFHYLSVGLPVVATRTKGQLELESSFKDLIFYYSSVTDLVEIFNGIDFRKIELHREECLKKYKNQYSWSIQGQHLKTFVQNVLDR